MLIKKRERKWGKKWGKCVFWNGIFCTRTLTEIKLRTIGCVTAVTKEMGKRREYLNNADKKLY